MNQQSHELVHLVALVLVLDEVRAMGLGDLLLYMVQALYCTPGV